VDEVLVAELLRQEFRTIDRGRHDREPSSSFSVGLQVSTGVTRERGKDAGELLIMAQDLALPNFGEWCLCGLSCELNV
jgi:hypothetical protein